MKKYRTGGWGKNLIEEIEVEKETEYSVWIKGRRAAKKTDYHNYFDTWEDAKLHLLAIEEKYVASMQLNLERALGKLRNLKELRQA
jgi:hypothetical protein